MVEHLSVAVMSDCVVLCKMFMSASVPGRKATEVDHHAYFLIGLCYGASE